MFQLVVKAGIAGTKQFVLAVLFSRCAYIRFEISISMQPVFSRLTLNLVKNNVQRYLVLKQRTV